MNAPPRPTAEALVVDTRFGGDAAFAPILFSRTHDFAFAERHGRLLTRQFRLGAGHLRIGRVASTGHRVTLSEDADATLLLPQVGSLALRIAGIQHDLPAGSAALMPPQHRQTRAHAPTRGAFLGDILMIPMKDLADLAHRIGAIPPGAQDVTPLTGPAASRLTRLVGEMLTTLTRGDDPLGASSFEARTSLLRDCLADALAQPDDASGRGRTETIEHDRVRRAEAYLRAHAAEPLSTADLAHDLDISLRSLQLAFQRVNGESPRSYLNRVRLDLAHARLMVADPVRDNVTTIALDCGFTHLGRFAGAYADRFGQSPSQTLSTRSRARPHAQNG
jgi:AraC-like DNA-binding protein